MDEQGEAVSLEGPPPLEQAVVWLARALRAELDALAQPPSCADEHEFWMTVCVFMPASD